MNDSRDLKAIAEACQQHQLLRFMRSHGALYIRNDNGIVFDVHQNRSFPEFMAQNKDYADLVLAANPETILAMIAENERLSADCSSMRGSLKAGAVAIKKLIKDGGRAARERDQLKAENERLSTENSEIESAAITYIEDMQEAQRENARLTELFTVGMTLDGNLRVYGDWQSVRKAQEILAERDQLRAEIAGLRTGYEAYEQVNAELKAEVEALRNALRPLLAHWDDLRPGESINVDAARAALGQGEQS